MNWMSIAGICLIVAGAFFSFFGIYINDKQVQKELSVKMLEKNETIDKINASNEKLIDQNASLLSSKEDASNTNKNLLNQNKSILDKIDAYQYTIEEKNKKIEQLHNEVHHVKQYSYYATFDIYGHDIKSGYNTKVSSDLSDRMSKIITELNGKVFVKNSKSALTDIDNVINIYPNYPFGYWAKFTLLKTLGKVSCKEYAQKAIDIFKITTSIQGHDASHDEALKVLKKSVTIN